METNTPQTYLITIKRNVKRLIVYQEEIKKQNLNFDKIFNIFYGIDGKELSRKEILKLTNKFGCFIPHFAISCAASHILLWEFLSHKNGIFIILEDDTIPLYKNLIEIIVKNKELLKNGILYIKTTYTSHYNQGNNFFKKVKYSVGLGSYVINNEIAKKLFLYYKSNFIDYHIDVSLNFSSHRLGLENYHYFKNNICYDLNLPSSTFLNNEKFFLRMINGLNYYYYLKVSFLKLFILEINTYNLILIVIGLFLGILFYFGSSKKNFFCISFFILGLFLWDVC
jgi:GR25 family glycosyltransferase involved in LPS biosynthesis